VSDQPPWDAFRPQDPRHGQGQPPYPPQQPYGYQPSYGQQPQAQAPLTQRLQYGPQPGDPRYQGQSEQPYPQGQWQHGQQGPGQYPPPGVQPPYPPYGQQPPYQEAPQPPRNDRKPRALAIVVAALIVAVMAIGAALDGGHKAVPAAATASAAATTAITPSATTAAPSVTASAPRDSRTAQAHRTAKARTDSAEAACAARGFASGDIYVRWTDPGVPWTAQELGGEWVWNVALGKCLTSVQMEIAASPPGAGNCTQVGYVADNPCYDVNATPAPPLKDVAAETGPAC
jgi:hypothetical protein